MAGRLYGIGVGPGDPELITVKGVKALGSCSHLFVPKAREKSESLALEIAGRYVNKNAKLHELVFPMVTDTDRLEASWNESAEVIAEVLRKGDDACFLTLGDPLLYSTYIYLVRALLSVMPDAKVETIPGVTAFSTVAALTNFPIGEGKEPVTIIPTADDLGAVRDAFKKKGVVVLMKIGKRLAGVLDILEEEGVIADAVFVAYAGQGKQYIETDLPKLKRDNPEAGYLSTILVHVKGGA
jgi:precorrin-2/cobalt-factor-2 C20-methyltransferase